MPLFPCPDCGNDVSTSASACPKCGHPFTACPYCARAIAADANRCPWCGNSLSSPPESKPKKALGSKTKIGCGTILVLLFLAGMIPSQFNKKTATSTVATPAAPPKPIAVVSNSAWDGSVYQVERWLKHNLKDPDSFQAIEWSPVAEVPPGSKLPHKFIVRCKYRAKNSFGGYVIEQKMFYLSSDGDVVNVKALP